MLPPPNLPIMDAKTKRYRLYFRILFLVFSLGLGFWVSIATLQEDLPQFSWQAFLETSASWLQHWPMMVAAILLLGVVIITSGIRLHILIKSKLKNHRFIDSLIYGILARYYVLITPWSLGGQPITMGIMYKRNIPVGLATSSPMLDLLTMRIAMLVIVLVALLGFGHLVDPVIYTLGWLGFLFTCVSPIVLILSSFQPFFAKLLIRLARLLTPKKYHEKVQTKIELTLNQYREAFALVQAHPHRFIWVSFFAVLSQIALLTLPYFVIASFNPDALLESNINFTILNVMMLMAIANAILGTVPTLGSAGAAEFTFATVFSIFISGNVLFWSTFLWRFLLFYFWLVMGIFISVFLSVFAEKQHRLHHLPQANLPLKVFLFNDGFFPIIDGVVRAVDGHARYLTDQGVDVTVVVPFEGEIGDYPYKILPINQFKIPGFYYPIPYGFSRKSLYDQLYYEGPAIYHAHAPFFLGRLALKLSRQFHIPLVTTFHSKYYDDYFQATKSEQIAKAMMNQTMRFFNQSQAIWTVSEASKQTMKQYGIRTDQTKIFTNGISFQKPEVNDQGFARIDREYALEKDTPIILFVGQLIWQKNIKFILDTFVLLEQQGVKFQAVFIGEGRNRKEILSYLETLKMKSKILFTGKISEVGMLSGFYSIASLFFFPSFYDTDGIVMKEAAAHDLPTLVLEGSTVAQVIKDRDNGFVVVNREQEAAQMIKSLLQNPDLLKKVGLKAHQTLALPWSEALKDLIPSYLSIMEDYYS